MIGQFIIILIGLICLFKVIKGKGKCIKKVTSILYISLIVLYFIFRTINYVNLIYNLGLKNDIKIMMYGRFIDEFVLLFIVVVSIINFIKYKKDRIKTENID